MRAITCFAVHGSSSISAPLPEVGRRWHAGSYARGGRVVALDVLAMEPIAGVEFIQGDFLSPEVLALLEASVGPRRVDLVLSDMAPNLSGMRASDQARWLELAESAERFASACSARTALCSSSCSRARSRMPTCRTLRVRFASVVVRKPAASKKHSAETYALARGPIRVPNRTGFGR